MASKNLKLKETIFFNGKFIASEQAKISVFQPGLLYGWGLFETMRYYNGKIVYFHEHLKRLQNCARLIKIKLPYPPAKIKLAIDKTVKLNALKDACVRVNLWKGEVNSEVSIQAKRYKPYPSQKYQKGFRCQISQFKNNEGSYLSRIKSNNYLLHQLAYLQAQSKGFDEAIILNNRGLVSEASRSNIFLLKGKDLFTPALECGCLEGITRKVIFDLAKKHKLKIQEGSFSLQDLYNADEIFLTNALMGLMPVASIEEYWAANRAKTENLTALFMKDYTRLLKRGN